MGVFSHRQQGCVKLRKNEKERTAKSINRKWDTEQEYNSQQSRRTAGR